MVKMIAKKKRQTKRVNDDKDQKQKPTWWGSTISSSLSCSSSLQWLIIIIAMVAVVFRLEDRGFLCTSRFGSLCNILSSLHCHHYPHHRHHYHHYHQSQVRRRPFLCPFILPFYIVMALWSGGYCVLVKISLPTWPLCRKELLGS